MQQRILLLLFFLLCESYSYAQYTQQIVFDFNKGAFVEGDYFENGKIKPQPTGGFAILKIINVNTFRWKVEIEGRSVNYVTPVPSELQTIFRLSDQTGDRQKTETAVDKIQQAVNLMNTVKNQVDEENEETNNSSNDLSVAMAELVEACEEYVVLARKIAEIKFTRMELINTSKQKWESYSAMDEKRPASLSYDEMKKTYEDFSEYYSNAAVKYSKALIEAKAKVPAKPAVGASEDDKKKYSDAVERVNDIKSALKKIEDSHGDVYQDNFLSLVQDVIVMQDAMDNPGYFEVVSPPIQIDGDYVDFNIKTTPTKMNDLMPYDFGKTFPVEIPAKGGLKVDFSVGPTFSFGHKARSDNYYFKSSDSTLQKLQNQNSISPGLAALMHFYSRRGKNVNYGGLFGVGAGFQTVKDANVSFYLGGSIIFGKREKLMLNAGVSYLSVDRLKKDQFSEGIKYDTGEVKIESVTEKVILPSFFFGISYNLTNKVEIK